MADTESRTTCCVCFEQPEGPFVACTEGHALCMECLSGFAVSKAEELAAHQNLALEVAAADEEKKQLRQLAAALDERATRIMPLAAPIRLANGNDASMVGGFASRKPRRKPRPLATPDGMTYEELMAQMSMGGCGCGVSGC